MPAARRSYLLRFLLFFIIVFGLLARRLRTPYQIVMVVGGVLLGFPAEPAWPTNWVAGAQARIHGT
jgi:NhaP-type Na+/H+ or K+/H+ antiporter